MDTQKTWIQETKKYETPILSRAVFQIINTLLPFFLAWGLAAHSYLNSWNYGITLAFMVFASLLLVRIFIFFHDCTHGSFFGSSKANAFWGTVFGLLTYTPYDDWRRSHGIHHNHSGNLDHRGVGDVWTLTLAEYRSGSASRRLAYRIYRNPVFLFLLVPPLLFMIIQRFPHRNSGPREKRSVLLADIGIGLLLGAIAWFFGWQVLVFVHLPTFYLSSVLGVWLFYVQHQFDPGYWEHEEDWDRHHAALLGSSHYDLPRILQWFSGNIGFHHIHHTRPRIPNYRLQECYENTPELRLENPLTLGKSFSSLRKHIWDEAQKRLLTFREVRELDKISRRPGLTAVG